MMLTAPGFRDANILTRTTLQVDESLSTLFVAQLAHALQRVPGVLLAEIAAGTVLCTQCFATLMAVYGLGMMTPIGWGRAGLVWVYALIWALLTDPIKLLAYRIFDPIDTPVQPKKPHDVHAGAAPVPS